jgi:endo-1,4-beta-xylanase
MPFFLTASPHPLRTLGFSLLLSLSVSGLGGCGGGNDEDSEPGECPGAMTFCGDECVDTESSDAHCGECDSSCGDGLVCTEGSCEPETTGSGGSGNGGSGGSASGSGGRSSGSGGTQDVQKFVGNITTYDQVDPSGLTFSDHWDQITPENAGKWGSVENFVGGGRNWATLDAIYAYTESKSILFKQHAFVWGSQQPSGNPGSENVRSWIQAFCERYPNTKLIDVVNEPPPHTEPNYTAALGGGTNGDWAWITQSFEWARQYCPGAILILNDYNNIEWEDETDHFIDITNTVLANGGPIDAVGAQSHDLDHEQITADKMIRLLEKLHGQTGLPVYITEYDISDTNDQNQLALYEQHLPYFLETEWIHGVTIWGWISGATWSKAPNSGIVNNGTPRPAMTYLMDLLGRPSP